MDIDTATVALEAAGFTVVPAPAPPAVVGGVTAKRSDAVQATRDGASALVSLHRFADGGSAVEAGSSLGAHPARGRSYFAAGSVLVVVEADDPELLEAAHAALTEAASKLR